MAKRSKKSPDCPYCGETLEQLEDGVWACMRCADLDELEDEDDGARLNPRTRLLGASEIKKGDWANFPGSKDFFKVLATKRTTPTLFSITVDVDGERESFHMKPSETVAVLLEPPKGTGYYSSPVYGWHENPALSKRAEQLLQDIGDGDDRIFYYSDNPPGWTQLKKLGLAERVKGTDKAELTSKGNSVYVTYL